MPLVRVSQSLYDKIKMVSERTGWTMRQVLDKITENVEPKDFRSVEVEVQIKVKDGEC